MSLVSVVVPVFNGERHLGETVESVLDQSYDALELVVVDDGSTDRSAAVVAGFADPRIRLLRRTNAGTGAARNAGVAAARGELIAHLDADDLWSRSKLELQVGLLARRPEIDVVGGRVEEFVDPGLPEEVRRRMRAPRGPLPGTVVQALLVRREAHRRVGPFETSWAVGQDLAWVMRAGEILAFAQLEETVLHRRLHGANKGLLRPDLAAQRCRIIKEALDRRRAEAGGAGAG